MFSVDRGGDPAKGFRCFHLDHGANGRKFTDKEASGEIELKEDDMSMVLEQAARSVVSGKETMDQAVARVARTNGMSPAQAREAVTIMIETIEGKEASMAESKTAAKRAAKTPPPKADRRRVDKTAGTEFARVRDELGLTAKQCAEATGEAGMGASGTYIYILTREGASTDLFNNYEAALRSYARANKIGPFAEGEAAAPAAKRRKKAAAVIDEPVEIEGQVEIDEAEAEIENEFDSEVATADADEQVPVEA